jgi:hypothetical protein
MRVEIGRPDVGDIFMSIVGDITSYIDEFQNLLLQSDQSLSATSQEVE